MAEKLTELGVTVHAKGLGALRHSDAAGDPTPYRFTYQAGIADEACAALNLPPSERDYATPDIPAPFEQALPEMNLSIFPTALWKFVVRDRMGLLWASSRRRIGRIRFHAAGLDARLGQPGTVALAQSDLISVRDGDALFLDTVRALQDIPGIPGIQPKVLVTLTDDTGIRSVNTDSHILKANHPDYLGATIVEALCLEAAEAAGLPSSARVLSGDGKLLAVERFDIKPDGHALGFDELGAILGRTSEHKYESSLEEVARAVREFAGPMHSVDSLRRLFTLCVLNNALRNGDAHLKNFGLLYDRPADATLSPTYDVLTTTCFERLRNDAPALTLEGRQQWDDYAALGRFGQGECLLRKADIRKAMQAVLTALQGVLPRIGEAREKYPYAAATLWVMRAEWLASIEVLERALEA